MNIRSSSFFPILCIFIFLCLPTPSVSELCNKNDKEVLLQIKKAFGNPYLLSSWTADSDCCIDWYQVACDLVTNRINSLTIFSGNLSGHIPSQVGDLPFLETLVFRKLTNITGTIPSEISKLVHLKLIRLSWTNLTGSVPSFFGHLKNLTFLDLSFNQLTGSIPPSLSLLPNVDAIHLDCNNLTGNIPDSFGNFVGQVPDLYLSHNQLTGLVPKSLGGLNFSTIDFSRNKLEGDISFLLGKNKTLLTANFSRNTFEFDFSKVEFPESLTSLDLSHNGITGSLPVGLTGLDLQFFNVSYNRLCGQIPIGGSLQNFGVTEYFHNSCLCGSPLPAC